MRGQFLGGVSLVAGTTIGAGMLALPVVTAFVGFWMSIAIFFVCWAIMLFSAYCFLDANLAVAGEPHLVSMSRQLLGKWAQPVTWVIYLVLLYSLTAAYISASIPLLESVCTYYSIALPRWVMICVLPLGLGSVVYFGTQGVDIMNRIMMVGLCTSYLLLVTILSSHIDGDLLNHIDWRPAWITLPVVVTAFGYHIIIPSLTTYMNHDRKQLRAVLTVGSLVPLLVYIVWELCTLGIVPILGPHSLSQAWQYGIGVDKSLMYRVSSPWVKISVYGFSWFAIITSFLGVTLSLSGFLMDGLRLPMNAKGRVLACVCTFFPPMIFISIYQRGFLVALEYAGACVAILLIAFPVLMVRNLSKEGVNRSLWVKILMVVAVAFAAGIIIIEILEHLHIFDPFIKQYVQHV